LQAISLSGKDEPQLTAETELLVLWFSKEFNELIILEYNNVLTVSFLSGAFMLRSEFSDAMEKHKRTTSACPNAKTNLLITRAATPYENNPQRL